MGHFAGVDGLQALFPTIITSVHSLEPVGPWPDFSHPCAYFGVSGVATIAGVGVFFPRNRFDKFPVVSHDRQGDGDLQI